MSFLPFHPSVQQSFHSNTAFSANIPPVNQIANDPSSSTSMQNELAVSLTIVVSDPSMSCFISESTVSDILDLD
jgi:hypothetical protein